MMKCSDGYFAPVKCLPPRYNLSSAIGHGNIDPKWTARYGRQTGRGVDGFRIFWRYRDAAQRGSSIRSTDAGGRHRSLHVAISPSDFDEQARVEAAIHAARVAGRGKPRHNVVVWPAGCCWQQLYRRPNRCRYWAMTMVVGKLVAH